MVSSAYKSRSLLPDRLTDTVQPSKIDCESFETSFLPRYRQVCLESSDKRPVVIQILTHGCRTTYQPLLHDRHFRDDQDSTHWTTASATRSGNCTSMCTRIAHAYACGHVEYDISPCAQSRVSGARCHRQTERRMTHGSRCRACRSVAAASCLP